MSNGDLKRESIKIVQKGLLLLGAGFSCHVPTPSAFFWPDFGVLIFGPGSC